MGKNRKENDKGDSFLTGTHSDVVVVRHTQRLKKNNTLCTVGNILTQSDFPYEKKPNDPFDDLTAPAPPDGSLESPDQQPSSLPPMDNPTSNKSTCQICGKVFNTKEELTIHMETEHQSPKKKV